MCSHSPVISQIEQGRTEGRYLDGLALVHFNDVEVKAVDSFPWGQKHRFKREVVSDIHENLRERHRRRKERCLNRLQEAVRGFGIRIEEWGVNRGHRSDKYGCKHT